MTGRINHPFWSILPSVGLTVLFGLPVFWFVLSLLAYEGSGSMLPELLIFSVLVGIVGSLTGLAVLFAAAWEPEAMFGQLIAFGIFGSLSFSAGVAAVGSVVSALNAQHDSVTADLGTRDDVLLTGAYLLASGVLAFLANAVRGARR